MLDKFISGILKLLSRTVTPRLFSEQQMRVGDPSDFVLQRTDLRALEKRRMENKVDRSDGSGLGEQEGINVVPCRADDPPRTPRTRIRYSISQLLHPTGEYSMIIQIPVGVLTQYLG